MRKTKEELEKLKKSYNADVLWSWSRFSTYLKDPYSYFLKYIKGVPEDRKNNAYSYLGGEIHDLLERHYVLNMPKIEMLRIFNEKVELQKLSDIKFTINNEQNENIGNRYYDCIRHFILNFDEIISPRMEAFIWGIVGNNLFHGYIDMFHVEDGKIVITDFKTSTMYKGKKVQEESGQLLLYAYLLFQILRDTNKDLRMGDIVIRWNFLKYLKVDMVQANGKIKTSYCLRNELCQTTSNKIKMWCKKYGLSEDETTELLHTAETNNQLYYKDKDFLEHAPDEIKNKFKIHDCIVEIPTSKEIYQEFLTNTVKTCFEINNNTKQYFSTKDDRIWWSEIDDSNLFYYLNLCGYNKDHHLPLKEYLEMQEEIQSNKMEQSDVDKIFASIF